MADPESSIPKGDLPEEIGTFIVDLTGTGSVPEKRNLRDAVVGLPFTDEAGVEHRTMGLHRLEADGSVKMSVIPTTAAPGPVEYKWVPLPDHRTP